MLGSLIATLLICIGVANTTPICNYEKQQRTIQPKKANVVSNYELDLTVGSRTSQYTSITADINTTDFYNSRMLTQKQNITGGNEAINVIGNWYAQTLNAQRIDNDAYIVACRNAIDSGILQKQTEYAFMLKITPYNINVETTIQLNIFLNVGPIITNNNEYNTFEYAAKRRIYKATDSDWNQYIDMQLATYLPYTIRQDITNINNGFYYEEEETEISIAHDLISEHGVNIYRTYTDSIEINIVPKVDNYIYIDYVPIVYQIGASGNYGYTSGEVWQINTAPKITGTNIIPDGTYEVINIPGLMFDILGMPFAFVSQAFNLTLFPGTPYQINIANLFLSVMAVFIFVWLVSMLIKIIAKG